MQSRSRLTQNTVYASMGVSKTAAKKDDPTSLNRDLKGAPPYKKENISYITNMLGYLSSAMELLKRAVNDFTSINSDSVSPDGMLGGKGHVMGVRDIKTSLSDMVVELSNTLDTLSDELNNPGWELDDEQKQKILDIKKKAESDIENVINTISQSSSESPEAEGMGTDELGSEGMEEPLEEAGEPADEEASAEEAPAEEAPAIEAPAEGEPAEDTSFPEMGELEEAPAEGAGAIPKTASNKIFIGSSDNMESVARTLSSPVLAGLIKTANATCASTK